MKKFTLSLMMMLAIGFASAQSTLTFCEDVNGEGKPITASHAFMVGPEGGVLKILVKTAEMLNTEKLTYKINLNKNGSREEELSVLTQKVGPDWNYVWKEMVFYDPGKYTVTVYNQNGAEVASGKVSIISAEDSDLSFNTK